jgi:hypothetical protein
LRRQLRDCLFHRVSRLHSRRSIGGAFAVAASNAGHLGANPGDGIWAWNDPQLRIDFGYRGPHVTSQAAKAIITAYYGEAPRYSYFDGCSDGGREGLQEAQRYPADFNGIVAGSPAHMITEAMERFMWEARNGLDAQGNEVLPHKGAEKWKYGPVTAG